MRQYVCYLLRAINTQLIFINFWYTLFLIWATEIDVGPHILPVIKYSRPRVEDISFYSQWFLYFGYRLTCIITMCCLTAVFNNHHSPSLWYNIDLLSQFEENRRLPRFAQILKKFKIVILFLNFNLDMNLLSWTTNKYLSWMWITFRTLSLILRITNLQRNGLLFSFSVEGLCRWSQWNKTRY